MDNFDSTENASSGSEQDPQSQQEEELSHSDKMIGIFTEPAKTYERIAQYPPKTMDWFFPVLLMLVLVIISQFLMMGNKELYYQMKQKQLDRIQKNLKEQVDSGRLTQQQANDQMNMIQDRMDQPPSVVQKIIQAVGILIVGFIFFFIVSGIYFLFAKFVLKGDGTYASALVANGMTSYIAMIGIVIAAILAISMGRVLQDTSLASFLDTDKSTFAGWIFAKIDVFTIWAYALLSIGLAKMFKSKSTVKYYITVFGIWIVGSFLFFLLAKAVPFLKFFGL